MIFHLHTPDLGGTMVYSDYLPRLGEKLRLPKVGQDDGLVGIFEIQDVMYSVPFDKSQRVDVYAIKIGELPEDLSYSNVMRVVYKNKLERLK